MIEPIVRKMITLEQPVIHAFSRLPPQIVNVTEKWLSGMVRCSRTEDDVLVDQFLTGLICQGARKGEVNLNVDAENYLCSHGNIWVDFTQGNMAPGA